jgi:bifunctional pyridoxal-dependent enzyme with beta-cystathionase and maltose regulon repressor activities
MNKVTEDIITWCIQQYGWNIDGRSVCVVNDHLTGMQMSLSHENLMSLSTPINTEMFTTGIIRKWYREHNRNN